MHVRSEGKRLDAGTGRFVRGLTMSAACLLLPTAAHALVGGDIAVRGALFFAVVLLSIGCVAMADRRRSATEITILLVVSQPVIHVLLAMGGHHSTAAVLPGPAMTIAHFIAAVALGLLLGGAESAAWSMASLSATALLVRVRRLLLPVLCDLWTTAAPAWPWTKERPRHVLHIASSISLRGPPRAA